MRIAAPARLPHADGMGTRTFLAENARWLGAGMLLAFLSSFGQTFFVALSNPVVIERHGLTDGSWGAIYALGTTASAALMVWAGGLADRFRIRTLATAAMVGLACACAAMAWQPALWALPPLVLALRFFGQGMLSHLPAVAMARWFARRRGQALAIGALGFAAGQAVLPPAFVALLPILGFAPLWLICAGIVLAAIPAVRTMLREERTPQDDAAKGTQTTGLGGHHWTRADVLRLGTFWAILPQLLGPPMFGTALFFHTVHIAESKGWPLLGFAALFTPFVLAQVAASFAAGWAVDRFGALRLFPAMVVPMAVGFAMLSAAPTLAPAALALMVVAVTTGGNATVPAAFWAEAFGTRNIGAIKATATAVMVLGTAIGPAITGAAIDAGWDFPAQMPLIAAYLLGASALAQWALYRARRRYT